MMDKLVEDVARAIIRRRAAGGDEFWPPLSGAALDRYVDTSWRYWVEDARAAILATLRGVREPTEGMEASGVMATIDAGLDSSDGVGVSDMDKIWQAMIDTLIAEIGDD